MTDSQRDGLYNYDAAASKEANDAKPWKKDPNYFRTVRISAVALAVSLLIRHFDMNKEIDTEHKLQDTRISRMVDQRLSSRFSGAESANTTPTLVDEAEMEARAKQDRLFPDVESTPERELKPYPGT